MGQSTSNQAPTHIVREGSEFVAYMIIPPDGGWGWIIVLISFIGFVFLDGITFSFGLLRKRIAESLSINTTNAAIVGSAFAGTTFASGVFACAIGNRYGFRIVMIVGAVILIISMVIITFLHNIYEMCGVYGFIGGIGGGFIMISLILPCGFYFDKKRPLAMGLSSSGTGVGAIVFPPMIEAFVNANGWRNTLLFEAGIISMFLILAIFLRPIEPVKVHMKRTLELDESESLDEQFVSSIDNTSLRNTSMRTHYNDSLSNSVTKHPTLSTIIAGTNRRSITLEDAPQEMLQRFQRMTSSKHGRSIGSQVPYRRTPGKKSSIVEMVYKPRESIIKKMFKHQDNPGARPLYRSDVLYGGSVMRLGTYTEKDTEIEYHLDVTRPATEKDITEEVNRKCLLCPEAITRGLKTLVNIKLLKSPTFVCFSFSAFFVYFAFHVPFLYTGEKLRHYGIGHNKRLLICLCGFGVASGRILSGIILMVFPNFGALTFLIISCCTAGLSIIAFTFDEHLLYHAVCITTYGFTVGIFLPVRSIIIVDLLGLNQLTSATGMVIIFQGFGSVLGPPTADFLKQNLNDVNAPFHVAGFGLLLSSFLLLLMKMIDKYLKKRRSVDQG